MRFQLCSELLCTGRSQLLCSSGSQLLCTGRAILRLPMQLIAYRRKVW